MNGESKDVKFFSLWPGVGNGECDEGVLPGSAAGKRWCSVFKGQCQRGWWDRCVVF